MRTKSLTDTALPGTASSGQNVLRPRAIGGLAPFAQRAKNPLAMGRGAALFGLIVVLPTLLATLYFGLLASDRYVSEASFVVRSSQSQGLVGGLGSFLKLTGIARSQDDGHAVQDFMMSRDAVARLEEVIQLRSMYSHPSADVLARYPSLIFGESTEELFRYYKQMIQLYTHHVTGVTTLRVQAFTAEDAQTIARQLLEIGETVVNRLNDRLLADAIRSAEAEVTRAETRLLERQVAMTTFRTRELIIDPGVNSTAVFDIIARLSSELAETTASIRQIERAAPNSPQLAGFRRRAAALETQIAQERARVTNQSDGLADKMAEYERLTLERDLATRMLATAVSSLETARADARRQLLYLARVVEPHLSDYALRPQRLQNVLVTLAGSLVVFLVAWLLMVGVREHAHADD